MKLDPVSDSAESYAASATVAFNMLHLTKHLYLFLNICQPKIYTWVLVVPPLLFLKSEVVVFYLTNMQGSGDPSVYLFYGTK